MIPAWSPFGVVVRFGREQVLVSPRGEIDVATTPDLGAILDSVVDQGHTRLILDLAEVDFMGVCGRNVIVRLAARLRASSGELTIRSPSELTRWMLDIARLSQLVETEQPDVSVSAEQGSGGAKRQGPEVRSRHDMASASLRREADIPGRRLAGDDEPATRVLTGQRSRG